MLLLLDTLQHFVVYSCRADCLSCWCALHLLALLLCCDRSHQFWLLLLLGRLHITLLRISSIASFCIVALGPLLVRHHPVVPKGWFLCHNVCGCCWLTCIYCLQHCPSQMNYLARTLAFASERCSLIALFCITSCTLICIACPAALLTTPLLCD